jgi:hypothetical protein
MYQKLELKEGEEVRRLPRLETVLDVAATEYGFDILACVLADLVPERSNSLHQFFAEHVNRGGTHVTANFDRQIEHAGGTSDRIVHIHGAVGEWSTLRATLSVVQLGFERPLKTMLLEFIQACEAVIFIGYGGRDYFDVDPFLSEALSTGAFLGKTVFWIEHTSEPSSKEVYHRQLDWLDGRCASVRHLHVDSREAVRELADAWRLSPIGTRPPKVDRASIQFSAPEVRQERATTRLYASMGLHNEVRERLEGRSLDHEEETWAARAAWARGQYREYADHWRRAMPGEDNESWAMRARHDGAALWLRGELRRARAQLARHVDEAKRRGVTVERRLDLIEVWGRVLQHMSYLPDTRYLASKSWKIQILAAMNDASPDLGVDDWGLRDRCADLRLWLKGERDMGDRKRFADNFEQAESLNAMLNFRHGDIRRRAQKELRNHDEEAPKREEYRRLQRNLNDIGAFGDAARVPLLPGAATAFTWREVRHGFHSVDYTSWNRTRYILGWLLKRVQS